MSDITPKRTARTVTVTQVGRRLTNRTQTKVTDEYGHDFFSESLDAHASLSLSRLKATAIAALKADGVEAEPIKFALERVRFDRRRNDSHDDDSLVGLAAQSLAHIHQLDLFEQYYGKSGERDRAMHHAYALGRLNVLMCERTLTTKQMKDAAASSGRARIETMRGGKVTKAQLVAQAIAAAGSDASAQETWTHLLGILEREGLRPLETGAKEFRRIDCEADGVAFTFGGFKTKVSRLKSATGKTASHGWAKGK